jgi:hypothetical protein
MIANEIEKLAEKYAYNGRVAGNQSCHQLVQ